MQASTRRDTVLPRRSTGRTYEGRVSAARCVRGKARQLTVRPVRLKFTVHSVDQKFASKFTLPKSVPRMPLMSSAYMSLMSRPLTGSYESRVVN